ncbi:MAG: alanine racemase [Cyclobacteriaceae bacterium]
MRPNYEVFQATIEMNFSELTEICEGEFLHHVDDQKVTSLCIDTRNLSIQRGAVFFAIDGDNHDGHSYVKEAYEKGIRHFVVEKRIEGMEEASVLLVPSSVGALQVIVAHHRKQYSYPVIGITGSNGKTIVKEWLSSLLSKSQDIVKSPKSYNSQIGVPLSVWQMSETHTLGIFEAGISKTGEMSKLENIIKPDIGIFTNIGEAHNEGFISKKEKAAEKAVLFKGCKKIIYPKSDSIIEQALISQINDDQKLLGWGVMSNGRDNYHITVDGDSLNLKLKFSEPYFIENAIHCAITMHVLGMSEMAIQSGLNNLPAVKMRLEIKQAIGQSYLIDDTYNNDLYGLEVALDFLSRQNQKNRKSVILSDVSQSGINGEKLYKKVNELLKKNNVTRLVGIGPEIKKFSAEISVSASYFPNTDKFLDSDPKIANELVLVKGARNFSFERIILKLEKNIHQTVLEINLENIIHNLNFYRSKLQPDTKVMAMVKAYAYGGGILEIANLLQYHQVDYLGVAYIDEAVELRKHGIHIPIMIMNPSSDSFGLFREFNLEPEIYSLDLLNEFLSYFGKDQNIPGIHIKIESGMNRLGFIESELDQFHQLVSKNKNLKVKSMFSHLAGSENPIHDDYTENQVDTFNKLADKLSNSLGYQPLRHIANTSGISRFPEYHFDMVRLGIGLYGFDPTELEQKSLKPATNLKSTISQIKNIMKGDTVGYGRKGVATKDMKIATIPIGYADGYLRAFSNGNGSMLVRNQLAPVFGNICMDMTMLDVTNINCEIGDEVIVFGQKPTIKDLADQIDTIPYEIMTNIGQRVKRVFQSE